MAERQNPPSEEYSSDSAYVLQAGNIRPEDIAEVLIFQNYPALLRLATTILGPQQGGRAREACIRTLHTAVESANQNPQTRYLGEGTPLAWLYSILLRNLPGPKFGLVPQVAGILSPASLTFLQAFPPQLVAPFVILLLDGMTTDDLATALRIEPRQAALDGLKLEYWLDSHPLELNPTQQARSMPAPGKKADIHALLQAAFPLEEISLEAARNLVPAVLHSTRQMKWPSPKSIRPLDFGIVGLVVAGLVLGLFFLNRSTTPQTNNLLFPTPTATPPLPTPLAVSKMAVPPLTTPYLATVFSSQPDLSADGTYLVFVSNGDTWVPGDTNQAQDVFLFHYVIRPVERISVNNQGDQADGPSSFPSISDDGRYVTFSSVARNLDLSLTLTCEQIGQINPCSNIYLRDLKTGTTRQVSVSPEGQPADGPSYLPSITADGRWIFFWSSASNLTPGSASGCKIESDHSPCFDLYAYSIQTQTLERIFVGKKSVQHLGNFPIEASADGRFMLIELYREDQVAIFVGLNHPYDTYLYDRESRFFTPLNTNEMLEPGNQPIFNAGISASGEEVIFTSYADNLLTLPEVDTNLTADVFVKHLASNTIQRVSISTAGNEGSEASGLIPGDFEKQGPPGQLTSDGRVALFLSAARELSLSTPECLFPDPAQCTFAYLHNRFGKKTTPADGFFFTRSFPEFSNQWHSDAVLSGNGDWLALVSQQPCILVCQEISLISTQSDPTAIDVLPPKLPLGLSPWDQEVVFRFPSSGPGLAEYDELIFDSSQAWTAARKHGEPVTVWWEGATDAPVLLTKRDTRYATAFQFSPEGSLLAVGTLTGEVTIWSLPSLPGEPTTFAENTRLVFTLPETGAPVMDLAFSPLGDLLAITFSDPKSGLVIWKITATHAYQVHTYDIQGTGQTLFSADNSLLMSVADQNNLWIRNITDHALLGWDRFDGNESVLSILEHDAPITSLAVAADDHFLVTGTDSGKIYLWRMARSQAGVLYASVADSIQLPGPVLGLQITADSHHLAAWIPEGYYYFSMNDGTLEQPIALQPEQTIVGAELDQSTGSLSLATDSGIIHVLYLRSP